ncbi:MAG: response regulator [Chitinophagaceae bacterium]
MNNNPVFIVDDDTDDHHLVRECWKELGFANALVFFKSGEEVLQYLQATKVSPFLILCDVNVPAMGGFELKSILMRDELLNYKSVPFIFWSTYASNRQIKQAFSLSAHGFFIKGNKIAELKESLSEIINYWQKSKQPEID